MSVAEADFHFVRDLVQRESAIVLEPGKEYLVESRLMPLARRHGMDSVSDLVAAARQRPGSLTRAVVDALTTNETSWFRDAAPFRALADHVLPELLERRRSERRLRLWSAACSSGQEPYTVAMQVLDRLGPDAAGWAVDILGTDLSEEMLERARSGRYSQLEMNRGLPAPMLVRYFERAGAEWAIAPQVRRLVRFDRVNLAVPLPLMAPFDVVLLRNVLIYFSAETKRLVLDGMLSLLRPDGWLVLGAAETTLGIHDGYERVVVGPTSLYRPLGAAQR